MRLRNGAVDYFQIIGIVTIVVSLTLGAYLLFFLLPAVPPHP